MRLRQQILRKNDCYKAGRSIAVKGVMIHSTGANNPRVSRYVPGDNEMGFNSGGSHWNRAGVEKCVHAFIGAFAGGGVGTVQTLPWTMRGWHCGGYANNTHISIEICEDDLEDEDYFRAVYREAVEVTAMLCGEHGLDPLAPGVVICHAEGHGMGWASNHGDVLHWWPRFGLTMDDFRADVARAMKGDEEVVRYNTIDEIKQAAPWAEDTIRKMIRKGLIAGSGKKDANGLPADMDLSMDMLRMLRINDTAGVYGS